MPSDEVTIQKLVAKAAPLLKKAPMLTVPQGMRAAIFSSAQSTNPTLQMRVRRMLSNQADGDISIESGASTD